MDQYPHLTVATIVQRNNEFLMVEEIDNGRRVINQPAGHVEVGESLFDAAIRETREETGWSVRLEAFIELICSDSLAAYPVLRQVSEYYGDQVDVVLHQLVLPYHRQAWIVTQVGYRERSMWVSG